MEGQESLILCMVDHTCQLLKKKTLKMVIFMFSLSCFFFFFFSSRAAHSEAMTISMREMFGNFIVFKEKTLKFKQRIGRYP